MNLMTCETQRLVMDLQSSISKRFLDSMRCSASGRGFELFVGQQLWDGLLGCSPQGYAGVDGGLLPHVRLDTKAFRDEYPAHAKACSDMLKGRSAVVHLDPVAAHEGHPYSLLLVHQPNGSQRFPDFMLFVNGVGLSLEAKSSANDLVNWNGGLPRQDALHLFNHHGGGRKPKGITLFQGCSVIWIGEEADLLKHHRENLKRDHTFNSLARLAHQARAAALGIPAKECHPLPMRYYTRAMYNSPETYFAKPQLRQAREAAALDALLGIFLVTADLHPSPMDAARACGKLEAF